MKNLKILLTAAVVVLTSSTGCKDKTPIPELPPATQEGKNTLGCYINGKPYAIWDGSPMTWKAEETTVDDFRSDSSLLFTFQGKDGNWNGYIGIKNPTLSTGTFVSQQWPYFSEISVVTDGGNMPTSSNTYGCSDTNKITVILTYAKNHTYAGTFSGTLVNEEGVSIRVTDGRFDIKRSY